MKMYYILLKTCFFVIDFLLRFVLLIPRYNFVVAKLKRPNSTIVYLMIGMLNQ